MRFSSILLGLFSLATPLTEAKVAELVSWDKYSLKVNGTRVFIKSDTPDCARNYLGACRRLTHRP